MAQRVEIRRACASDIDSILAALHPLDVEELAMLGVEPRLSLEFGLEHSRECLLALVDGKPLAIFGVVPKTEREGISWLMTTSLVDQCRTLFVRQSIRIIARFREEFDYLHNIVPQSNTRLIAWLHALGFQISEPLPINGVNFVHYEWRRHV